MVCQRLGSCLTTYKDLAYPPGKEGHEQHVDSAGQNQMKMKNDRSAGQPGRNHAGGQAPRTVYIHEIHLPSANETRELETTIQTSKSKLDYFGNAFFARSVI